MFSLDVSAINATLADGVQIGEQAGIWFHQSAGSDFTYGADGSITNYAYDSQMWLDQGNDATRILAGVDCAAGESRTNYLDSCGSTQLAGGSVGSSSGGTTSGGGSVPAPGGLALILVGLAGLGRKFRGTKA